MIYALQAITGGPIKLGTTEDLPRRLAQLEAHYRQPLAVLATFEGGRDEERAIHKRFAHLRYGRTEQFRPAADLMAFLGRPLLVDANPGAVEAMPPKTEGRMTQVVIRSIPDWKTWVEELSGFNRTTVSDTVDRALVELARNIGFPKVPPRR